MGRLESHRLAILLVKSPLYIGEDRILCLGIHIDLFRRQFPNHLAVLFLFDGIAIVFHDSLGFSRICRRRWDRPHRPDHQRSQQHDQDADECLALFAQCSASSDLIT